MRSKPRTEQRHVGRAHSFVCRYRGRSKGSTGDPVVESIGLSRETSVNNWLRRGPFHSLRDWHKLALAFARFPFKANDCFRLLEDCLEFFENLIVSSFVTRRWGSRGRDGRIAVLGKRGASGRHSPLGLRSKGSRGLGSSGRAKWVGHGKHP